MEGIFLLFMKIAAVRTRICNHSREHKNFSTQKGKQNRGLTVYEF